MLRFVILPCNRCMILPYVLMFYASFLSSSGFRRLRGKGEARSQLNSFFQTLSPCSSALFRPVDLGFGKKQTITWGGGRGVQEGPLGPPLYTVLY